VSMANRFWGALYAAFVTTSSKQLEAYGRFAHNLAAACVIGAISIIFTENRYGLGHAIALLAAGVSCFVFGALYSRGE
jgi:uncharacterized membrane protein YgdD (TMEM256/DUF423 family)